MYAAPAASIFRSAALVINVPMQNAPSNGIMGYNQMFPFLHKRKRSRGANDAVHGES